MPEAGSASFSGMAGEGELAVDAFAPVGYAGLGSTLFALAHVSAKRGFRTARIASAYLVSMTTALFVAVVASALTASDGWTSSLDVRAIGLLFVAGVLAHNLAQLPSMVGVDRIGPSVAIPIQMSSYALAAVAFGTLFLSQHFGILRAAGAASVLGAIWVLGSRESPGQSLTGRTRERRFTPVMLLPVIAGLALGGADIFRKLGIAALPDPETAVAISVGSALSLGGAVAICIPEVRRQLNLRGTAWFVFYGAASAVGLIMVFKALQTGEVSVVSPILATQPVMVAAFSRILLPGIEKFDLGLLAAIALVVLGSVLLGLS